MLKYDFTKSLIANIKACIGWINFLIPEGENSRKALEQTQEDTDAALCEVAEMLAEQEEAIVELAELIGG